MKNVGKEKMDRQKIGQIFPAAILCCNAIAGRGCGGSPHKERETNSTQLELLRLIFGLWTICTTEKRWRLKQSC